MSNFTVNIKDISNQKPFIQRLKLELEHLPHHLLPLQAGLTQSSQVSDSPFTIVILSHRLDADYMKVKAGVLYTGIIGGCNCADDPSPVDEINEYCEIEILIDRTSGAASIRLV